MHPVAAFRERFRRLELALLFALAPLIFACKDEREKSAELARGHVSELARASREDVGQVRTGLPLGAGELAKLLPKEGELDASSSRESLQKARNRVQDLRVAKSTFFAVVSPAGVVVRNDREQDRMAGKQLFDAFPALRGAAQGYLETRGSFAEAAEVRGRADGQWVAAAPVRVGSETRALYVTGWSWSSYAYRLENSLRSSLRGSLREHEKMPLFYAFVIVDGEVYGAPVAPDVNIAAVRELALVGKLRGAEPYSTLLELTGRGFGLAAVLVPELGDKVAIAVLRSET